ncbi:unnamed protein product [Didymodactylos carnosus]|uniref:G-protein coupled receptors family 1 profile domain-containing protein n=1 Tax=Didymodactylos carnosus TaxID=1234261 RepID=A0A814XQ32_9BILA|nr:unnamed protein product [Didymodactylos carnosus]CAF1217395.1 unnamed protein product [Didymodactylos carnosus]CAF3736420.1 unnamed protein product [Didymodactylos carnosus]CAF3981091.1 unnamed protein product [Didymodactylos carnosus]
MLLRSLTNGFQYELENNLLIFCKIRRYFTHTNYLISSCLLTLATINRYARVKQALCNGHMILYHYLCCRKITYFIVPIVIIICCLVNIHIAIYFQINTSSYNNTSSNCFAQKGTYRLFLDIFFLLFYGILPPFVTCIFGLLTVLNVRFIRRDLHPNIQKKEFQLMVMVLAHIMCNAILSLPYPIDRFYETMTINRKKNEEQVAVEALVQSIGHLLFFSNHSASFYLYILSTKGFKNEFIRAAKDVIHLICQYYSKITQF